MSSLETLDFPHLMGNLASELTRVQRVLREGDLVHTKSYLWEALKIAEVLKHKFPNSENFRLYEHLAGMWAGKPSLDELEAVTRYTLSFYLDHLEKQ